MEDSVIDVVCLCVGGNLNEYESMLRHLVVRSMLLCSFFRSRRAGRCFVGDTMLSTWSWSDSVCDIDSDGPRRLRSFDERLAALAVPAVLVGVIVSGVAVVVVVLVKLALCPWSQCLACCCDAGEELCQDTLLEWGAMFVSFLAGARGVLLVKLITVSGSRCLN